MAAHPRRDTDHAVGDPGRRSAPDRRPLAGAGSLASRAGCLRRLRSRSTGWCTRRAPCRRGREACSPTGRAGGRRSSRASDVRTRLAGSTPAAACYGRSSLIHGVSSPRAMRTRARCAGCSTSPSTGSPICARSAAAPAGTSNPGPCVWGPRRPSSARLSPPLVRAASRMRSRVMRVDVHPADFDLPGHVATLESLLHRAAGREIVTYDELLA